MRKKASVICGGGGRFEQYQFVLVCAAFGAGTLFTAVNNDLWEGWVPRYIFFNTITREIIARRSNYCEFAFTIARRTQEALAVARVRRMSGD